MQIRQAREEDAEAACVVLRRSITELCRADHQDDGPSLAKWLANKTPENVRTWIGNPDNHMLVADDDGAILGVAAIQRSGKITLNYVSPDARFRGVSKALMTRARGEGVGAGHRGVHAGEHRDGPPILSLDRLRRGGGAGARLRRELALSDGKTVGTAPMRHCDRPTAGPRSLLSPPVIPEAERSEGYPGPAACSTPYARSRLCVIAHPRDFCGRDDG